MFDYAPVNYNPLPDIEILVHFKAVGLKQVFPNLDSKAIKGLSFNALANFTTSNTTKN